MQKIKQALHIAVSHLVFSLQYNRDDLKIVHEAQQQLSELKGLLEDIEWINTNFNAYKGNICVCCYNHINDGHKPGCKLAKFIKEVG